MCVLTKHTVLSIVCFCYMHITVQSLFNAQQQESQEFSILCSHEKKEDFSLLCSSEKKMNNFTVEGNCPVSCCACVSVSDLTTADYRAAALC